MAEVAASGLSLQIIAARAASIIAAAGCGKTEEIVKAIGGSDDRRLILTHTHAGVDALRRRLREHNIPSNRYSIDTIAGWCLRFAASYPKRSGLQVVEPRSDADWSAVYCAILRLLAGGAIEHVLKASYAGLYVDEYQDCSEVQHQVVVALADTLPICIFGDPLQAIFDFKEQAPVDWQASVFPKFPKLTELTTAHRWHRHENSPLATWIETIRPTFENGGTVELDKGPACVEWSWLPDQPGPKQNAIIKACQAAMGKGGPLVVIADAANEGARAAIAKSLGKNRFSMIEPVDCGALSAAARRLQTNDGAKRLTATLDFVEKCMTGSSRSEFDKAVIARAAGRKLGEARYGALLDQALDLKSTASDSACLGLIEGFSDLPGTHIFRRELLAAFRSALKMVLADNAVSLNEALWRVQSQSRHAGRSIPFYSVGSTLLVKGLEFASVVIVHSPNMGRKDWYVALTRATHRISILAPSRRLSVSI